MNAPFADVVGYTYPDIEAWDDADVRTMLRSACERAGGAAAFSRAHGILNAGCVRRTISGKRKITPQILRALKIRRKIVFVIDDGEPAQ